jgi:hypothetical protein
MRSFNTKLIPSTLRTPAAFAVKVAATKSGVQAGRAMRCCEYEFKSDPGKTRYGTIAQNCLEHNVLKNLVKTDENDMYSVNYMDMVALLCASLKDAHQKIDELSAFMDNSD